MTTENTAAVEETTSVELVATDAIDRAMEAFKSGTSNVLSTFTGGTHKDKLAQLSAMQGALKIKENLNKTIQLANFVIQPLEVAEQGTGELKSTVRVILVDKDGTSYYGFGTPMMNALQDIVAIMGGLPDVWESPVPVKVTKVTTRQGFEAFNLVVDAK